MTPSFKSLRYTTAIVVSLVVLSTPNQAHAQCAPATGTNGNDVITCSGTSVGLNLRNGDDMITNTGTITSTTSGGGLLEFGNGSSIFNNSGTLSSSGSHAVNSQGVLNVTNSGTIAYTGSRSTSDAIRFSNIGDQTGETIIIDNQATGILSNTRAGDSAAAIEVSRGTVDAVDITNAGMINTAGRGIRIQNLTIGNVIIDNSGSISGGTDAIFNNTASMNMITNSGTVTGRVRLGAGDDVLINTGDIMGDVNLGAGDDVFTLDLDTGSYTGTADGSTHSAGDTLNIDSDSGDVAISLTDFRNFEFLNLSGDNVITTNGSSTFEQVNLLNTTDLVIASGSTLTADDLVGTAGNDVTVDAGGTLNADTTLSAADETFTLNGNVTGDINLGDGDDVLRIDLDTGSHTGNADGGAHAAGDTLIVDSDSGDATLTGDYINFEDLDLSGDNEITLAGDVSVVNATLLGMTNLSIANGGALTATSGLSGTAGNDINIDAGGVLTANITLTAADEMLTNAGMINGEVNFGDGDDSVTNSGVITATSGETLEFGAGDFTLNNSGTISSSGSQAVNSAGLGNIVNSGTIEYTGSSGTGDAIRFNGIGDQSGRTITIDNQAGGVISNTRAGTSAAAIELAVGMLGTIDITNAGIIDGAGRGIRLTGATIDNAIIDNTGTIMGDSNEAIFNDTNAIDMITNSGTITGDIDVGDSDDTLTNSGAITGNTDLGNGDDVLTNTGNIAGDIDFGDGDDTFNLDLDTATFVGTADGGAHTTGDTLNLDSDSGDATVDLDSFVNFEDANLTGDQEIATTGTATFENVVLDGTTDISVGSGSTLTATTGLTGTTANDVTIDAGGTLNADTTLTVGDDNFDNAGTFNGTLDLGMGDDMFTNAGDIVGDVTSAAGTNMFDFTAGMLTGDLNLSSGTDTINFNGTDITGNVIDSDLASGLSSLFVNADTTVTGDVTVNSTQLNAGNVLTVNDLNTDDLIVDVASNTNFGSVEFTGGSADLTGMNITALITDAVTDGDEIPFATGTGTAMGIGGGAGQAFTDIDDTSLLFNFGIADGSQLDVTSSTDANTVFIVTDRAFQIREVVRGSNEANVGDVLEVLEVIPPGINSPEIQAILGNVASASNAEELAEVLQAAIPAVDGGAFSAAQNVTGNTLRLVSDRLTVIRDHGGSATGVSSGSAAENLQLWGQIFGQKIQQGERQGIAGFDAHTRGFTLGADTEILHDDTTVGLAFSYADTDVDSNSVNNTRSEINSYNISAYGDYDINESTYLVGDIGYTYGDNESTRFNVGGVAGLNADSDFGSHQVEARLIAAKDYQITEDIRVTPKVQAHYIHFQAEDVSETGAGGAGLNVESEGLDILEFGIGVDARKDYVQDNGALLSPEISVGYRYDVIGDPLQTTATFAAGGPSFQSEGADPDRDTFSFGAGLGYTGVNATEFTLNYDYEIKDEFESHSALFRVAAPF